MRTEDGLQKTEDSGQWSVDCHHFQGSLNGISPTLPDFHPPFSDL